MYYDINRLYSIFRQYKDIFPYMRKDYLQRKIDAGNILYKFGVVIVFQKYKKSVHIGTCFIPAGDYMLSEMVNSEPGNGLAGLVLLDLIESVDYTIWTTVRRDNKRAVRFYYKMGFKKKGEVKWKNNTIPGLILAKKTVIPGFTSMENEYLFLAPCSGGTGPRTVCFRHLRWQNGIQNSF